MGRVTKNKIAGIVFVIIGLAYAYMSLQLKKPTAPKDPGSTLFPLAASIGLAVCGLAMFFQTTAEDRKEFLDKQGWIQLGLIVAVLAGYILAMKYIGFVISTPVVLFIISSLFSKGLQIPLTKRLLYSALLSVIFYVVFVQLFHVMLPKGILPF